LSWLARRMSRRDWDLLLLRNGHGEVRFSAGRENSDFLPRTGADSCGRFLSVARAPSRGHYGSIAGLLAVRASGGTLPSGDLQAAKGRLPGRVGQRRGHSSGSASAGAATTGTWASSAPHAAHGPGIAACSLRFAPQCMHRPRQDSPRDAQGPDGIGHQDLLFHQGSQVEAGPRNARWSGPSASSSDHSRPSSSSIASPTPRTKWTHSPPGEGVSDGRRLEAAGARHREGHVEGPTDQHAAAAADRRDLEGDEPVLDTLGVRVGQHTGDPRDRQLRLHACTDRARCVARATRSGPDQPQDRVLLAVESDRLEKLRVPYPPRRDRCHSAASPSCQTTRLRPRCHLGMDLAADLRIGGCAGLTQQTLLGYPVPARECPLSPSAAPLVPPRTSDAPRVCAASRCCWWLALAGTRARRDRRATRPAGDAFRLDATFWSLARGGATAAALMGPPTRVPRRAPSLDPPAARRPPNNHPSAKQPTRPPSRRRRPRRICPFGPARPAAQLVGPVIPAPTAIPQPSSDDARGRRQRTPSHRSRPSAEDIARSAAARVDAAPRTPEQVDEGPQRFIRGRSVPPFWIDREWTTHRTRALTLPPLFFHRTGSRARPEKLASTSTCR
jgi:hypothetical protein